MGNEQPKNRQYTNAEISATVAELAKNENLPSQGVTIQQTNHSVVGCAIGGGIGAVIGGAAGVVLMNIPLGIGVGAASGCAAGAFADNLINGNESITIKPIPTSTKPPENAR